jgi:hypothetical protein
MTVLDTLRSIIGRTRNTEAGLREQIGKRDEEQAQIIDRPAPRPEVEENLASLVADLGRQWIAEHGLPIVRAASGRVVPGQPPTVQPPSLVDTFAGPVTGPLTLAAWAALDPDRCLAGLRRVAQATPFEEGLPMTERLPRLAEIAEERRALQREHAIWVTEFTKAKAGLENVDHLAEEKHRRWLIREKHEAWRRNNAVNSDLYRRRPDLQPPEPERPEPGA